MPSIGKDSRPDEHIRPIPTVSNAPVYVDDALPTPCNFSYKSNAHDDDKTTPSSHKQSHTRISISSLLLPNTRTSRLAMAKCLAVALMLLVVLAYCDGRELNDNDHTLAATHGAGAGGGVGEAKNSGLPDLPLPTGTGTSTINGPLVAVPAVPVPIGH